MKKLLFSQIAIGLALVVVATFAFWFATSRPAILPPTAVDLPGGVSPSDITFLTTDPTVEADVNFILSETSGGDPQLSIDVAIRSEADESFVWAVVGRGEWSFFDAEEKCRESGCVSEVYQSPDSGITNCDGGNWSGKNSSNPASMVIGSSTEIATNKGYIAIAGSNGESSGKDLILGSLVLPYMKTEHRFDTTSWTLSGVGGPTDFKVGATSLNDEVCLSMAGEEMLPYDFSAGTGHLIISGDGATQVTAALPSSEMFPSAGWKLETVPFSGQATMSSVSATTTLQWLVFLAGVLAGTGASLAVEGHVARRKRTS